ncbi:MAG: AAA family ATPase [Nitrospira sp.]|nr:AAA family ATPase [Nitrospira sp.]
MYETYYQLKTKPFTLLPDPEFLYLGAKHKMALSLLEYGLANGTAFIVITGHPGTGKTTLLNRLLDQSGHPWVIGILSNIHGGLGGLMPWIAASFGLPTNGKSAVDIFHEFAKFLEHEHSTGRRVLLILDEAQNVGAEVLEELRLLSNLNDGRRRSLQILLSGQRGLQDLLKGPEMVQFAQRIGVDYVLDGLSETETVAYIEHRLQVAGRSSQLFTTLAGRIAFRLTGGIPRLINQLCDHALVYGYAEQAGTITARVLLAAAVARAKHGVLPFVVLPEDVDLPEPELSAERVEVDSLVGGHAQGDGQTRHSRQLQQGEVVSMPDPLSMYREGLMLKESGEYTKAIRLFDRLSTHESWAVRALSQKGLCLKAMGQHHDALTAIREASKRRPATQDENVTVQYLLARTLESQGLYDEAREIYVVLDRRQHKYRDVSTRLARLQDEDQDFGQIIEGEQVTRFASFWRGCGRLLQNMRR